MVQADNADVELDGFGLVKLDVLGVRLQSADAHPAHRSFSTQGGEAALRAEAPGPSDRPPRGPFRS
ncbi:hypothetical protein [Streptomyces sp. NPDC053069]|uniref:hypothetical protein n=1 Tax=Streptomyces sp. NPDC053069 TaxID=3365695 RepID=UPI0037D77481